MGLAPRVRALSLTGPAPLLIVTEERGGIRCD